MLIKKQNQFWKVFKNIIGDKNLSDLELLKKIHALIG